MTRTRSRTTESWLQLLVTWASGLLLLLVVAFLASEAVLPTRPPLLRAEPGEVRQAGDRYYLPIEVTNEGDESVQGLGVRLELRGGEEVVESATTQIDWVPEGSTREVVFLLRSDPRSYELVVDFEGYQVP